MRRSFDISLDKYMTISLTSSEFILLLPIALLLYYLFPLRVRKYFLLLINILFYASFGLANTLILAISALITWAGGIAVDKAIKSGRNGKKQTIALVSLMVIVLGLFKFGENFNHSIVVPLGLSFFTFQEISYIVDVRKGVVSAEKNFFTLLVYLSFFPTITSGPIYRYKDFIAEHSKCEKGLRAEYEIIVNSIVYVLYGYFLIFVIAGRTGTVVDTVYSNYDEAGYGGIVLLATAFLYSIQIYVDFAGYSAIAIGIARILGYKIPANFLNPYLSENIKEFWGRWHISLSSWLKDYIYIPLGGNRKGRLRKYINILITFVISGIWHGVSGFNFIIWGCLHGLYQVTGDLLKPIKNYALAHSGIEKDSLFHRFVKQFATFVLVTFAWIFFRTSTVDAVNYIEKMITTFRHVNFSRVLTIMNRWEWLILLAGIVILIFCELFEYYGKKRFDELVISQGILFRWLVIIGLSLAILIFGQYGSQHDASYFIYRDF